MWIKQIVLPEDREETFKLIRWLFVGEISVESMPASQSNSGSSAPSPSSTLEP